MPTGVDVHLGNGHVVVMDGVLGVRMLPGGMRGVFCGVVYLSGMDLRQSHRFLRMRLVRLAPDLLLEPHLQVVFQRHDDAPFSVCGAHRKFKTGSDKVDEYRNDKAVDEIREQTAHQRDEQIGLDGRGILVAHGLHVGHGVGGGTHAEAAGAGNDDGRVVVA